MAHSTSLTVCFASPLAKRLHTRVVDISAATSITHEDVFETLRDIKLITGPDMSSNLGTPALPRKRGPGRPPRKPVEKDDGHGHEPSSPVVLPRKYSIRWDPAEVDAYVQNWERKGHLRLKPDRLKWVPYRLSRAPPAPQPPVDQDADLSESDDEPVSDGSEDLGDPVPPPQPPPAPTINVLVPRPKTRSKVPTSHPSDDEADADEDDDQHVTHSMTRRSRSRQSTQTPARFDTPERRSLRSTVLSRKSSLQSQLGIGRRGSPDDTPLGLRNRTRSLQLLRGEQTTPMRRETRGRARRDERHSDEELPPPPPSTRKSSRRGSPVRKRRRIESSPEPSPGASLGKRGSNGATNGQENGGSPDQDGPQSPLSPTPPTQLRAEAERERSVSLGSGMVYPDVRPTLPVTNGATDTAEAGGAPCAAEPEPACAFTDDGSPLTSVKEELTDDASEGVTLNGELYDEDALCDEDAEGEPDEDAQGEVDESLL